MNALANPSPMSGQSAGLPPDLPLRDIHLPEPISWWPPAPGWWIVLVTTLLIIIVGTWWYRRRQRRLRVHRSAQAELTRIEQAFEQRRDDQRLVQDVSALLRRLAMTVAPRDAAAGLTGEDWLAFLDRLAGRSLFDSETGRQLIAAPYRPESDIDAAALIRVSRQWLEAVTPNPAKARTALQGSVSPESGDA